MSVYDVLIMATFIIVSITMISQCIDSLQLKLCDAIQLMNILPCFEIKAYKNGKRLYSHELIKYINKPVKDIELKDGVLYIEIY